MEGILVTSMLESKVKVSRCPWSLKCMRVAFGFLDPLKSVSKCSNFIA